MGMMPLAQAKGRRGSYNIGEVNGATWDKIHGVLLRVKPRVVLIMNDAPRAYQLADELPDSIIILRFYHHTDGKFWQYFSGQAAVNQAKAKGAKPHPRVYIDMNNEPSIEVNGVTNEDTFKAWRDKEIEYARAFRDAGIGYAMAVAFAKAMSITGDWQTDLRLVDQGIVDPLLHEAHDNEYLLMAGHDYRPIAPHAEYLPNYPENLSDPYIFTPTAMARAIMHHTRINGHYPPNFMTGRAEIWQIRSVDIGLGRFWFAITECILDYAKDIMEKITSWSHGQTLKEFFKTYTGGRDVNGLQTTKPVWAYLQPQYSLRHKLKFLTDWMEKNYSDECLGWCWFTVSNKETKPDSPGWENFYVQDEDDLHDANAQLPIRIGLGMTDAPDTKPVPPPWTPLNELSADGWGKPITIKPTDPKGYRFRTEPSTEHDHTIIGVVTQPLEVSIHTKEYDDNGDTWVAIRFPDGDLGYVADWVFEVVPDAQPEPQPEPEPTPDPEPEPIPDEIEYLPLEVYLQMPIDYFPADEGHRIGKTLVFLAYVLWAVGYALQGKVYRPVITDMSKGLVDIKAEAAKKKITQTMRAVEPDKVA